MDKPALLRQVFRLGCEYSGQIVSYQNDWRCSLDPKHDYVKADNSHSAFAYARWIIERGVPAAALAVVRLADSQADQ